MNATESEADPSHPPQANAQLPDQVPAVHIHHVNDLKSEQAEPVLASGQSTPSLSAKEQPGSGQSTPKPRPAYRTPRDSAPIVTRPLQKGMIRKLVYFLLRILIFYTRLLSKIVLAIFSRLFAFHIPKRGPVATPKVKTVELDDDQTEAKSTAISSTGHTPVFLTPRRYHSGASTPRNAVFDSVGQKISGVTETLEAVATKILPESSAKGGVEEKPREDLESSYVQEPKPEPGIENEKSVHTGEWEIVHRPGFVFELTPLLSPPTPTEGEVPQRIKPIRLTLDGEEGAVRGVKFHLDDIELTDVKLEPLTGTGQEGLWAVEIPRESRDLVVLRIS